MTPIILFAVNMPWHTNNNNMSLFRNKADNNKKNTKPQQTPDYTVHAKLCNMKFTIHR